MRNEEIRPRLGIWIFMMIVSFCSIMFLLARCVNQNQATPSAVMATSDSGEIETSLAPDQKQPPKLFFREGFPTQGPETIAKLAIQEFKAAGNSPGYEVAIYVQLRREAATSGPQLSPRCGIEEIPLFTVQSCAVILNRPEKDTPGVQYEEGWVLIDKCGVSENCQWDAPVPFEKKTIREVRAYLVRHRYV